MSLKDFNPLTQLWGLFNNPALRFLLIGYFLFFLAFSGFTNIFVVWMRDRFAWQPIQSGGVLFWVGVIASFVQGFLLRKVLPRFGEFRLVITGFSLAAIAFACVALVPNGYYLYGTQTLFAFGLGIASPSIRGIISASVPDDEQGKVSGGTLSLSSMTQILGPLLAGWSYDNVSPVAPMWIGSGLAVLAIVAIASGHRGRRYSIT